MTRKTIERYFAAASRRLARPAEVLLFGGGAAIVETRPRDTLDLDLELGVGEGRPGGRLRSAELLDVLQGAATETGIKVQAGEAVERWSMIGWADYQKHVRLWKRFGRLSVYLLSPEHFAVSKLARSSDTDLDDIRRVLKARRGSWRRLARLCGQALREAPASTSQGLFRRQVEHFLATSGKAVWGRSFRPELAVAEFRKAYASRRKNGA